MVGRFGLPSFVISMRTKSCKIIFLLVLVCYVPSTLSNDDRNTEGIFDSNLFAKKLLEQYGSDGLLSVKELEGLIHEIKNQVLVHGAATDTGGIDNGVDHKNDNLKMCQNSDEPLKCIYGTCLTASSIIDFHSGDENGTTDISEFQKISSTVLYQLQNPSCYQDAGMESHSSKAHNTSPLQVWGYGFLCVTLINLCALMGMVFLPLMKKSFYKKLLMFMVALAVGTLAGSSLLFLIPECFGMTHEHSPLVDVYVWKSTAIIGGVYLFFLTERFLKIIINYRRRQKQEKRPEAILTSLHTATRHRSESMNMSFDPPPKDVHLSEGGNLLSCKSGCIESDDQSIVKVIDGNGSITKERHSSQDQNIKSVAWMIIFGDGLHNFIDGLSIGAAFAGNIMTGISVSVAVICEELPHELGDFAILLNSGMTMKQALGYNFLSACMCYIGLVIGIMVGELTTGAEWIFAIAGGMFLYISLVDMLPEVNHVAETEEQDNKSQWCVFFIQNSGLLVGYGIMLILACYSGNIDFEP